MLAPATLAALPSTRAIETHSLPSSIAATLRGFAFYVALPKKFHSLRRDVFYVVDSRSPDRLGRIPTDQCSPSAGFSARRIHPIDSIRAM